MSKLAFSRPALALSVAMGAALISASPASAAWCTYVATDTSSRLFFESAIGRNMDRACDRARRQCNRQLQRWIKWGKVGRAPHRCSPMTEVQPF